MVAWKEISDKWGVQDELGSEAKRSSKISNFMLGLPLIEDKSLKLRDNHHSPLRMHKVMRDSYGALVSWCIAAARSRALDSPSWGLHRR